MGMDKYGVDTAKEDKTADIDSKCPECGKPVEVDGEVLRCPDHGTKPFEKKPD